MKTIVLFSVFAVLLSCTAVNAQMGTRNLIRVKGVVANSEGFPITRAYVFVDSLKTGFRTNKRGEYKLRVPSETDFISIYSEEYGMLNMVYNGEKFISFTFPKNREAISESELIKLGYVLDTEVFRNIGKKSFSEYSDIYQIIREKFSGVRIDGTRIYVRGVISLEGNQTPLFVVDGNYVNSISNINLDELKSIELLKGEDTALYGARGAAGVFIISLK